MKRLSLPSHLRHFRFFSSSRLSKEPLKEKQRRFLDRNQQQRTENHFPILLRRTLSTSCDNMERAPLLKDVVKQLEEFAPLSLAESWDNVGLLLEPAEPKPIKTVFLTNDLTEEVLEEAVAESADLVLSYHPPLFRALKKITQNTWKERIVAKCLKEGIAVYSPHTCWDTVYGGVNEWIASGLPEGKSYPIIPNKTHTSSSFEVKLEFPNLPSDKYPAFKKFETSHPGCVRVIFNADGHSTFVLLSEDLIAPFKLETGVAATVCSPITEDLGSDGGTGRIHELRSPISIKELVDVVKKHCGLSKLQIGLAVHCTLDAKVSKIAICAGSGASVLNGVPADIYLTGEMSHHEVLEANHNNVTVILTHHSNTERGFLPIFAEKLSKALKNNKFVIKTVVSKVDHDPLTII